MQYIWQRPNWPQFTWNSEDLLFLIGKARKAQGQILAQASELQLQSHADWIVEEAFATSAIEGEQLDRAVIRSSVARRLGLPNAGLVPEQRPVDGLVAMLLDATLHYDQELTEERLHGWHAALFPTHYSGIHRIDVGSWRQGSSPMRVISGGFGKEIIHFEAPPSQAIAKEMQRFLSWWQKPPAYLDGILRAGIAHFWFVSIHPYDDGNGRISRALSDMALSQDEQSTRRLYNLSSQIINDRESYYEVLEKCQKGNCDITIWLKWFLECYIKAITASESRIGKSLFISRFWKKYDKNGLNARQIKVIQKLLEAEPQGFEGGINNRKYVSLTGISAETAKRDLADLEDKGLLIQSAAKGRSTSYSINKEDL